MKMKKFLDLVKGDAGPDFNNRGQVLRSNTEI